jgi:hypothetical protein
VRCVVLERGCELLTADSQPLCGWSLVVEVWFSEVYFESELTIAWSREKNV